MLDRAMKALLPVAALALLAACGGGSSEGAGALPAAGGSSSSDATGAAGTITVGSANFTESEILAEMYTAVLEQAGYTVEAKPSIGSREVYLNALEAGEVDVMPEYVGTLAQVLNQTLNGQDANITNPVATGDPRETVQNMQPLLDEVGLTVFGLSAAQDQNSYAVTQETADRLGLEAISDLTGKAGDLTFGGPPECQTRPQCINGLERVYDVQFADFRSLDAGGPLTLQALADGTIDVGLVFSSDGAVAANDLVVLEDDKGLTPADNIITLAREEIVDDELRSLLTEVNEALTTEELAELNRQVGVDKADPSEVATQFLTDQGLLS